MTPEQRTVAVLGEIRAEIGRQGTNVSRLATEIGCDPSTLTRKLRGERELLLRETLQICDALHVTFPTLLRRADEMAAAS